MLANQNMLIEAMQANHRHTESLLSLVKKLSTKANVPDVAEECEHLREVLKDTDTLFGTLRDASTSDLTSFLNDVKRYAADVVSSESRELQAMLTRRSQAAESDLNDRFKKLEARVLSELATSGDAAESGGRTGGTRSNDGQLLKKVTNRLADFEGQVASQLQAMSQDIEKKVAFLSSSRTVAGFDSTDMGSGVADRVIRDLDGVKYDIGELKDLLNSQKGDTAHVKRIVLACERDMEDFTAAMDAVNVDLDEMRARVDSTHSIITSRQRVEATVTAEISTMRLDMGDMQEALKAHDAWMEDVSQSLQEAHERCHQLSEDIRETRDQTQAKLDAKTDLVSWNDMNDDIDASIKTVRDMASALRLEVDSRRRKVDDSFSLLKQELSALEAKTDSVTDHTHRIIAENQADLLLRCEDRAAHGRQLEETMNRHAEIHTEFELKMKLLDEQAHQRLTKLDEELRATSEAATRDLHERVDRVEQAHAGSQKDAGKRMNALDLRISGLQGATGESKRDISKLRDEVNSLTVKSAAHDVDIGQNSDDIRKLDRQRAEDNQRHKQDMDAVYEELDQKVYEKSFQSLEDNTTKLTRGVVKLCQVVGVFPGARMNDGSDEDLDVDVELLNWEDCAQNLVARVEKTWRQVSSQKFRSVLDLVSKKADHSVLRLLQISQQHIESQLDRVRHERELWKEVVDKRTQQPLQLALTLKDPHTGLPLAGPGGFMPPQGITLPQAQLPGMGQYASIRPLSEDRTPPMALGMTQGLPGEQPGGPMKPSPLAKRITNVNTAPTRLDSARKQA